MTARAELERRLDAEVALQRRPSRYGDSHSYVVAEREILHFHGDSRMDLRLTRERIRELKAEGVLDSRVQTRGPSADWVAIRVAEEGDVAYAVQLVEEAIRANS